MPRKPVLFPTLGPEVCDWIETFLCHGPGDVQGTPLVLDEEVRAFIWRAYEVYPKGHELAGRRRYRRAFFSRPKGRSKSEIAGAICCAEALGPVRFAGWGARGVPVGAPVTSPEILNVATEEGQAGNTYDNVVFMLNNGAVADEYDFDAGLTRTFFADGGVIEPITAAAQSKDGGKSTFIVADETHLWVDPRLKRLHATLTRNITKRKIANGWMLETSTMYGPGEGSVAEETHEAAKKNPGLLFDHRQAPDVNIEDDAELRGALEYVYGAAAGWTNIDGIIADEFRNPQKSEADNRRYWLNQPVKLDEAEPAIISAGMWARCLDPASTIDGRVVFGVDVSPDRSRSTVSVAGRRLDGRTHVEMVDSDAGTRWVEGRVTELVAKWGPLAVVVDPRSPAGALLPVLEPALGDLLVKTTAQDVAQACGGFFQAVNEGALVHIGQIELDAAVAGAATRPLGDAWAWSRRSSTSDITPLVAATLALWGFATAEGAKVDVAASVW